VPFQVLNQDQNHRRAVVALASNRVQFDVDGKPLPTEVAVPVGQKARGVYVLHGAGYVADNIKAAQYSLDTPTARALQWPLKRLAPAPARKTQTTHWREPRIFKIGGRLSRTSRNASTRHVMLLNDCRSADSRPFICMCWKSRTRTLRRLFARFACSRPARSTLPS
jgi:hypothetical protein